ncbi:MAG: CBS domain-containing protein [Planctomycetota bacterium]|jgi:CBS domain-containing protein
MSAFTEENEMLIPTPKDIMTKDVVSVKTDTPIYEALELMAERDVSGLPVVEHDMTLIGVLSEKDVLSLLYNQQEDEHEKTVSEFMTQPALYFDENENLLDICDFLKKNVFRRVPITSEGRLVGIISIRDVISFILRLRGKVPTSVYRENQ